MRFLDSGFGRLVRFGVVGGATGLIQLLMLIVLKANGIGAAVAYAIGLVISCQFNFALNTFLVWGDRPVVSNWLRSTFRRWVAYHISIALSIALNYGIFLVARGYMGDIIATLVAIGGSTLVKFVSLDRLAFKAEAA